MVGGEAGKGGKVGGVDGGLVAFGDLEVAFRRMEEFCLWDSNCVRKWIP